VSELPPFDVQPIVLEGKWVLLEPLEERHALDLSRFGSRKTFEWFVTGLPPEDNHEGFLAYVRFVLKRPATVSFAVVLKETGEAIGSTSYLDIRPADRHVEIGMTWIGESFRGGFVNPEMKLLMLAHAFEDLRAYRVTLKTDARNLQSQAAIAKLGAMREGTLRRHGVMPDGFVRDTVMFSVIPEEWPVVRSGLEARLEKFSKTPL